MPGAHLWWHCLKKAEVSMKLLKVLVSFRKNCPNQALLCAGVRDECIALTATLGCSVQVTLYK
eukprot:2962069-Rhodomonas_salina.3